ncbi:MAG: hypothetical protein ACI396_05040 [Acutalibacteraceae bacterium]
MTENAASVQNKGLFARIIAAALGLFGLIICIIFSDAVKSGISAGVQLCLGVLIPSLFLPMTLCAFLQQSGIVSLIGKYIDRPSRFCFNISGTAAAAFILGCISGYPSGAVLSRSLYECGEIDVATAKRLCSVCVCAGPAFILLGVGDGLLHSRAVGRILLCSHIIAAVFLLFVSGLFAKTRQNQYYVQKSKPKATGLGLTRAVSGAVKSGARSMLGISAYTVLFSAVISVLGMFLSGGAMTFVTGACEVTNACVYFANTHNIPMISAALGFSGMSVIAQLISAAGELCDIKRLLFYRLLSAAVSFAICSLLLIIFPQPISVQKDNAAAAFYISSGTMAMSCLLIAATAIFLYSLYQRSEPDLHDFF